MAELIIRTGARFRSAVCTTEVVVVQGSGEADLHCGGVPMLPHGAAGGPATSPIEPFTSGTQAGKRYATEDGKVEVLCTKAGIGSLSLGDTALEVKGAKPLPASD